MAVVLHLFPSFHPQLQARPAPDSWSVETHRARRLQPPWSRSRVDSSSASCWWRCLSARPGFSWRKASLLPTERRQSRKHVSKGTERKWSRYLWKETVYVWVLWGREVGLVGLEGPCRSPGGSEHSLLKGLLLMSAPLSTLNGSKHSSTH